jgi:AcrR family transcriptional regulator
MTRIVEAADRVFADVGYEAATMEQIAERAETSIGSVYQFFPNKGALFEALCDRYFERARSGCSRTCSRARREVVRRGRGPSWSTR